MRAEIYHAWQATEAEGFDHTDRQEAKQPGLLFDSGAIGQDDLGLPS